MQASTSLARTPLSPAQPQAEAPAASPAALPDAIHLHKCHLGCDGVAYKRKGDLTRHLNKAHSGQNVPVPGLAKAQEELPRRPRRYATRRTAPKVVAVQLEFSKEGPGEP